MPRHQKNKHTRRKHAFHEAGHAVVARALGVECHCVTMFGTLDERGEAGDASTHTASATYRAIHAREANPAAQLDAIRKDAIIALAGPCSQAHYRTPEKRYPDGWQGDYALAQSLAWRAALLTSGTDLLSQGDEITVSLSPDQGRYAYDFQCQCRDTAADLVWDRWPAITGVAEALMTRDLIDQVELDRLIAAHPTQGVI
jgi:hypothetical protein